jgi:hypothetical protein
VTTEAVTGVDERVKAAGEKAVVLAEALPYIREFSGKTVVISSPPMWCSCGSSA